MSVVKGFNSPITVFDDELNAVDEELAELEAAAGQSEDEDLYAGLQCGEQPRERMNGPVEDLSVPISYVTACRCRTG